MQLLEVHRVCDQHILFFDTRNEKISWHNAKNPIPRYAHLMLFRSSELEKLGKHTLDEKNRYLPIILKTLTGEEYDLGEVLFVVAFNVAPTEPHTTLH